MRQKSFLLLCMIFLSSLLSLPCAFSEPLQPFRFLFATGSSLSEAHALDAGKKICQELQMFCTFTGKPAGEITEALKTKQADASLSGVFPSEHSFLTFEFSLPYFRTYARFITRKESPIQAPDRAHLAGRRIGVLAASPEDAWLRRYFPFVLIRTFPDKKSGFLSVSKGLVDVFLSDGLALEEWMQAPDTQNCCRFLGGAFFERGTLSQDFAVAMLRSERSAYMVAKINEALQKLDLHPRAE